METIKVKGGVLPAMIVFAIFMLLTGLASKAQTNGKEQIKGFKDQIAIKQDSLKEAKKFLWSDRVAQLNKDIDSLKQEIAFRTPAKEVKKTEVISIDTATMIRIVKQQIRVLEEKKYKALSSNPDTEENKDLNYSIDSLTRVIGDLTPSKKEVVRVEKPKPAPSMAQKQTTEIGRTMAWGERKKVNTVNVQKYVNQSNYSQAVADVRLEQIRNNPNGTTMERPNGIISYNAIGRAASTRYINSAPKAFVRIVPLDPKGKEQIDEAITTDLSVGEEKELFLNDGTYTIYYDINGKTVLTMTNTKVTSSNTNHYWHNKAYAWNAYYNVSDWGNSLSYGW